MAKRKKKQTGPTVAQRADKYRLYQRSVQEPEAEVRFFRRAYRDAYACDPVVLREDFCGTFAVCCEWVKQGKTRRAIGVDLDPEPLAWGTANNLAKLDPQAQKRVTLLQEDVRKRASSGADVLAAQNFSFWLFKTRKDVVRYFKAAWHNIAAKGVMVVDMMGGPEIHKEHQTDLRSFRNYGGFKYEWEQARFDPITHDVLFHIHFAFKDGSRLNKAFTYDWRLWTMPEVREMLLEAGFSRADVYWENTESKTGEGSGVYRRRMSAPAEACWIAYVVAVK